MAYLVYPGACHSRFEHSIGTMHLATMLFDACKDRYGYKGSDYECRHLRAAALLHDIGHGPYSHGTESLFCSHYSHERMTIEIIYGMQDLLAELDLDAGLVSLLACGEIGGFSQSVNPALIQMISGPLGADRLDYLARDAYHVGVPYGRYALQQILDSICVVDDTLAIEPGGCPVTELVAFARYKMFQQVYLHHVNRAYAADLRVILRAILGGEGSYPTDPTSFLKLSDLLIDYHVEQDDLVDVFARDAARRIRNRGHYRNILNRDDLSSLACEQFCAQWAAVYPGQIFLDDYRKKPVSYPLVTEAGGGLREFPQQVKIPAVSCRYVFVAPELEAELGRALQEYIPLANSTTLPDEHLRTLAYE